MFPLTVKFNRGAATVICQAVGIQDCVDHDSRRKTGETEIIMAAQTDGYSRSLIVSADLDTVFKKMAEAKDKPFVDLTDLTPVQEPDEKQTAGRFTKLIASILGR